MTELNQPIEETTDYGNPKNPFFIRRKSQKNNLLDY